MPLRLSAALALGLLVTLPAAALSHPPVGSRRLSSSAVRDTTQVPGFPDVYYVMQSGPDYGPMFYEARAYGHHVKAGATEPFVAVTTIVLQANHWSTLDDTAREDLLRRWVLAGQLPGSSLQSDGRAPDPGVSIMQDGDTFMASYWRDVTHESIAGLMKEVAQGPTTLTVAPDGTAQEDEASPAPQIERVNHHN